MLYRFQEFELAIERAALSRDDVAVALRQKSFAVLVYLLRHRERVVSRDELLREIWPGTVVSENSVAQCVIELRRALGDDAHEARFIRTMGRGGYRFVAAVEEVDATAGVVALPATPAGHWRRWLMGSGIAAAILGFGGFFYLSGDIYRPPGAPAIAFTSSLKAAQAYTAGIELSRQYHAAEGVAKFQEALQLDPNFVMAQARIGYVYSVRWLWEEKGRSYLESAYSARWKLNELNRRYILSWYQLAHRNYPAAIMELRQLLARYPRETEAREELGRILLGEERYDEAVAELNQAIALDPSTAQAHNILSALFIAKHDFANGVAQAKEFVRLQPEEVNAYDTLALGYEAANDFEQAEKIYRMILERQPKFGSRIHLANALYRMGRWKEARQEFERYMADAPSDGERQWGADQLAVLALEQGDDRRLLQLARIQPREGYHDPEILLALRNGDLRRADELLALRPPHADRGQRANQRLELYIQGERALAAGDHPEALRLFQLAVKQRTPLYAVDWYEDCLASALLRLGRHDEAIREYHRVLAVYPRLALAWHGLGKALLAAQQPGLARQAFAKVAEIWKRGDKDLPQRAEANSPIGAI